MNDRDLLLRLARGACSGSVLAREFGLTRAAVWKRIASLREQGVAIAASPGAGYALEAPLDLLDAQRIRAALLADVRGDLDACEVAWAIDSTNAELLRRAASGGVQALFAEAQTAGRGRRGRAWASPLAAHLYLSLQRRFDGGIGALAGLSIAVGVAAAEALRALGVAQVGLKWPNDLVVGERKLGGILIEFGGEDAGIVRAVIGIGINVRMPAAAALGIDQPWIDLCALGTAPPSRNALATAMLDAQLRALREFAAAGLSPFMARWQAVDACAGRSVDVLAGSERKQGVALGIDARGALRVRHDGAERVYHSAEISLRLR
ncbi:MAG: bifunctional biotin--[acetyl-CoA-carboxylase] ligase/biotin operon repressor BirA [Proteobacteria bacterium]|nr:bifunctional biotin--[acetyl-CoA-carboxylase] ligase/biotin operon repressor BirA [Pseudomonadota bacterium]